MNIKNVKLIKSNLFGSRSMWVVLVEIIIIIFIVYHLANIFLMLVFNQDNIEQKTIRPIANNAPQAISYRFFPVELFGRELKKIVIQPTKRIVQSKLNLKLTGIIRGKDKSLALISKLSSKAKVYAVGEKIMQGVTLSEINNNNVVLLHNGQSKILKMEKMTNGKGVFRTKQNSTSNLRKRVSAYKKQLNKDPQKLASLFAGKPIMQDGKYKGIKISSTKNKELIEYLGLKDGDVIIEVDNIPLNNFARLSKLASKISSASKAEVLVLRDGSEQIIVIDLGN